ncbi:MAG TPA: DUF805 domain-containing protein [Stellaceae bacterium]|nr:DUF805 domain-containing protein [Stellaceae bacterium]
MKGNVIGFDPDTNTGAISGHDGRRYDFATADWHSHDRRPRHGDLVDFAPEGQRATQIYALEAAYVAPSFGAFYFSPSGRISRSQYWLRFFLPVFVIGLIIALLKGANGETHSGPFTTLGTLFQLLVLWPGIAMLVKRIHDRNKSGALVWLLYGPLILLIVFGVAAIFAVTSGSEAASSLGVLSAVLGVIVAVVAIWFFIEFGCMRGTIGENRFGPDPVREA